MIQTFHIVSLFRGVLSAANVFGGGGKYPIRSRFGRVYSLLYIICAADCKMSRQCPNCLHFAFGHCSNLSDTLTLPLAYPYHTLGK